MRPNRTLALHVVAIVMVLTLSPLHAGGEEPAADRVLKIESYTSEKGRALGRKYDVALRNLNASVFNCMPWLDVKREGIGFFKPKHLHGDIRYLSLNVSVDQRPTDTFIHQALEDRASAMFSRYVPHLLRLMAHPSNLLVDPLLDGFTVILSWLRTEPLEQERPVFDTIASFLERPVVLDYVAGRLAVSQLADHAYTIAWNGETRLGYVRLRGWADNFTQTHQVAGYTPDPRIACR